MGKDQDLAAELESHREYLMRFADFLLRDKALAEDAVQDFHLMMCANCTAFSRQIAFIRCASRRVPEALGKAAR